MLRKYLIYQISDNKISDEEMKLCKYLDSIFSNLCIQKIEKICVFTNEQSSTVLEYFQTSKNCYLNTKIFSYLSETLTRKEIVIFVNEWISHYYGDGYEAIRVLDSFIDVELKNH